MAGADSIYRSSSPGRIVQCEVLSEFTHLVPQFDDPTKVIPVVRSFVMVLSQDCDLEQDYNLRMNSVKSDKEKEGESQYLPFVILMELYAQDRIKSEREYIKSDLWRKIRDNNDERYQYLREVKQDEDSLKMGIPATVGDFKRYFAVETCHIYHLHDSGQLNKRSVMNTPYSDAVLMRFGNYISRIAIPSPHFTGRKDNNV